MPLTRGDSCVYFPFAPIGNYIASLKPKLDSKGKIDSKTDEILTACVMLWFFQYNYRDKEWQLGFPVKDEYVSKYKDRDDLNEAELAHFLESNERKEATFEDFVISSIKDATLDEGVSFQLKRLGATAYKPNENLIELLASLENVPKTEVELLISVRQFATHIPLGAAYKWLKERKYPFDKVSILHTTVNDNRMVLQMIGLHPTRYIGTLGFPLLSKEQDPDPLIKRWFKNIRFSIRIWEFRMWDYIVYKLANTSILKAKANANDFFSFYVK